MRPERFLFPIAGTVPLLLAATSAAAQQHDEQLWFQINTNVPIDDKLRLTLEQIVRVSEAQDTVHQSEFGGILGYRVAKGIELGIGYRKVGNTSANEDRLRQQVIGTFGSFATRFRVDERFHPGGDQIGFRIRPLVRYNHRLNGSGVAVFVSHESFILPNSTRWGQRSGYDRMRNVVGFVLPVSTHVAADIGYLNQYRLGRNGGQSLMEHALSLQLTINLTGRPTPRLDD